MLLLHARDQAPWHTHDHNSRILSSTCMIRNTIFCNDGTCTVATELTPCSSSSSSSSHGMQVASQSCKGSCHLPISTCRQGWDTQWRVPAGHTAGQQRGRCSNAPALAAVSCWRGSWAAHTTSCMPAAVLPLCSRAGCLGQVG